MGRGAEASTKRDPWHILGVPKHASLEEVRRAFRRKARLLHPDGGGDLRSIEGFLEIKEAYQEIVGRAAPRRPTVFQQDDEELGGPLLDGAYLFVDVEAEKAFHGGSVEVSLADEEEFCPRCSGAGSVTGPGEELCTDCGGRGRLLIRWGDEHLEVVCTRCGGTGALHRPTCPLCKGLGRISRVRRVEVRLPRGVKSGTVLRLSGQGPWRPDRQSRDPLYVEVRVVMPPGFSLLGLDILATHDLPIWTALSGGTIAVPTIDGVVECRVAPGTQQGQMVRVKGRGWIDEAGNRGDHVIRFNVTLPKGAPPPEAAALLELLRAVWPAGDGPKALPGGVGIGGREAQ